MTFRKIEVTHNSQAEDKFISLPREKTHLPGNVDVCLNPVEIPTEILIVVIA